MHIYVQIWHASTYMILPCFVVKGKVANFLDDPPLVPTGVSFLLAWRGV